MTSGSFEDFVAILGTKGGPAIRPGSSMPTSNLICIDGQQVVVDCGLGVTKGLVDQEMQLKHLSMIFITHLHSDHYLELGPLIHTAWTAGLKTMVDVWGPPGLDEYWHSFLRSMKADIDLRVEDEGHCDLKDIVRVHAIKPGHVVERAGMSVTAMRTIHPPLTDCFALSFRAKGTHIVFSGDTAPCSALEVFAQGADLLIHEAMLKDALPSLLERLGTGSDKKMKHWLRSHCFAHDAAQTATRAGVQQLALSHLIPSDDPSFTERHWREAVAEFWEGPLHVGSDGLRISL
ncbi:MAG: MBL fold metallo-hydrolase [Rhizobiaceae bacterium]